MISFYNCDSKTIETISYYFETIKIEIIGTE